MNLLAFILAFLVGWVILYKQMHSIPYFKYPSRPSIYKIHPGDEAYDPKPFRGYDAKFHNPFVYRGRY